MACLFDSKPLPEAMLLYCQFDPMEHSSMIFYLKFKSFHQLHNCMNVASHEHYGVLNHWQLHYLFSIEEIIITYWPLWGVHLWPVGFPHQLPVTLKSFPCYWRHRGYWGGVGKRIYSSAMSSSIKTRHLMGKNLVSNDRATFLAATKQLYEWFSPSVCPSVCLSVRHTFLAATKQLHEWYLW